METGRLPADADFETLPAGPAAAVSVNPPVLERLSAARPDLRVAGRDFPVPLPVRYDPPEACGLDRVLGAVGALHLEPEAEGVLLLDAGTCLTATVALRAEGILGGAILPGPRLMARALAEGTAALPLVEPAAPASAIGRTTPESIRSGLAAAFHGAARELVVRIRAESRVPLVVVAAGTGARALADVDGVDSVHPAATLWGVFVAEL